MENSVKIGNWGVVINGGRWKNREKWSKFGQKLHEFERFRTIFCILEKYFSKIVNWGGRNKLKCLEKNLNFGNYPPPTITVGRVSDSIAIKTVSYDFRVKIFFLLLNGDIRDHWRHIEYSIWPQCYSIWRQCSRQITYHPQSLPYGILIRNSIKKNWK